MKKVGKTTRPLRYDLNKILYHYTGSDKQIQGIKPDRVPEELWVEFHNTVQEAVIKITPMKKKYKNAKRLSEKASQIAEKRKEAKDERKGNSYPSECKVPKNNKER